MAWARDQPTPRSCSFCGKSEAEVLKVLVGPGELGICNECVDLCIDILGYESPTAPADKIKTTERPTLPEATRELERLIDSNSRLNSAPSTAAMESFYKGYCVS